MMAPAVAAVIEIASDDEEISSAVKPTVDDLEWASTLLLEDVKEIGEGLEDSAAIKELLASLEGEIKKAAAGGGDDDDDCVMLDGDPVKTTVVVKEEKPGQDGSEEELQIIAEKGEVACRDFPHPRHLCVSLPFSTSSHAKYCTMCHCYVCDCPAPCFHWGKGTLPSDHCHATDKDVKSKSKIASNRGRIQKSSRPSSTAPPSQQYTGHPVSAPQPFPPSRTNAIQPNAGRGPVASNVSQNLQMHPSTAVTQNAGQMFSRPNLSAPQLFPPSRTNAIQPPAGRGPVASNVSQNLQMHPSTAVTQNAGQMFSRPNVPAPQPFPPSRTNAIQPPAGRIPVANIVSQNQQMHPSTTGAQNVGQFVRRPKASAPGLKISRKVLKRPGAASPVQIPSVPDHVQWQHIFPGAKVASGSNNTAGTFQGYFPNSYSTPVISQGFQTAPHLQVAQNRVVGTGLQPSQCPSLTAQGTREAQCPSPDSNRGPLQDALAKLASDLDVSDYNTNPPQSIQQSASTYALHRSLLLPQAKERQGVEPQRSSVAATAQIGQRLPSDKAGNGVVAAQKTTQASCLLNSESSLTPVATSLNSLFAQPDTKN